MPSNTPNLNLYKKNPATDGDDTFNIQTMINDNLDKIDAHAGDNDRHVTVEKQAVWNAKETPAGAQARADTAKSGAISAAATDATTKANAAKDAAISAAAMDATTKANSAEAAAKAASIPIGQKGTAGGVAALDANKLVTGSGHKFGGVFAERYFKFAFANGVANQRINLYLASGMAGVVEVEITGSFNYGNASGRLIKRFVVSASSGGDIYYQYSGYTEVSGDIRNYLAISDLIWEPSPQSQWIISIQARSGVTAGNDFAVSVKTLTPYDDPVWNIGGVFPSIASTLPLPVQVIPDDTKTQSGYKVLNSSDTGVFAPAVHEHNHIKSVDKRDVKPNTLVPGSMVLYFADRFGNTGNNDWQDMLVLNGYTDGSGGKINALGFDKDIMKIEHIQAEIGAADWATVKTLAYVEDGVNKLKGMSPTADSNPNTIVQRNADGNFAVGSAIYFGDNDGITYDDSTNTMYARLDGNNYELLHRGNTATYAKSYGLLPAGADLNNYGYPGFWQLDYNVGYVNVPTTAYAILAIEESGGFIKQTLTEIWGNYIFYRVRATSSTSWTTWSEIMTYNSDTSFHKRGQVVPGTDLGVVDKPGIYFLAASSSYVNGPGLDYAVMNVYTNNVGYVVQEVTGVGQYGRRFRTRTEAGAWGQWMMVPYAPVASGKWGGGLTTIRANAIDTQVTVANTNVVIASHTPAEKANYEVKINFRLAGATPNVIIVINYADGAGPQSMTLISQAVSPGSYSLPVAAITAIAGSPISILANINIANAVFVSATLKEE